MITRMSHPPLMSHEDAELFVRLLRQIPLNVGWSISRPMEPHGSPPVFDAYRTIVAFPGGGRGEADGDTPSESFLKAWALAHLAAAEILMPTQAAIGAK